MNTRERMTWLLVSTIVALVAGCGRSDADRAANGATIDKLWFSVDDGKTWFAEDATRATGSFTRDGKTAYLAHVFRCKVDGKTFCAYLERPIARPGNTAATPAVMPGLIVTEVKIPGGTTWTSTASAEAAARITTPHCPAGDAGPVERMPSE